METASLRIKFTPLIKNVEKDNSECFLEIVPEITCIQNLDKIEWHQKSDCIEYIIPMTYKVIMRKQQNVKQRNDDLDKIYHSCVDLLPSSISQNALGAGDVTRILSDTVILDNVLENININNFFIKKEETILNLIEALDNKPPMNNSEEIIYCNKEQNDNKYMQKTEEDGISNNLDIPTVKVDIKSKSEIGDSLNNLQLCKKSNVDFIETVTRVSKISTNKDDSLRKLSLTPICSINTDEKPIHRNIPLLSWHSILCRILQPEKVTGEIIKDFLTKNNDLKPFNKNETVGKNDTIQNELFKIYNRELPEVRVAKFVKSMETEILPLKTQLYDIFKKCSFLGLTNTLKKSPKFIYDIEVPDKQLRKYGKIEKQTKCNRVVYSIVFDG